MIDINYTSTNGYYLCSECKRGKKLDYFDQDNAFYCYKREEPVLSVGVCRDFVERRDGS